MTEVSINGVPDRAVLGGVSAQVPMIVKVSPLPPESEPNSRTMSITAQWIRPLLPGHPDDDLSAGWGSADQAPYWHEPDF